MSAVAQRTAAPSEAEVRRLADTWFAALNDKAELKPMLDLLAASGLVMKFPEGTFKGTDGFKAWRKNVRNLFFDQSHTITGFMVHPEGKQARVSVEVRWEASTWKPPAARSEKIVANAGQTWIVVRGPEGRAVIKSYAVDTFTPLANG
jgi:hypothetical protein